jgi:hypothetical protein
MIWYRQSLNAQDTHCGYLRRGRVLAVYGVEFTPKPLVFGRVRFHGHPPDPDQICPECYRLSGLKTPGQGCVG